MSENIRFQRRPQPLCYIACMSPSCLPVASWVERALFLTAGMGVFGDLGHLKQVGEMNIVTFVMLYHEDMDELVTTVELSTI